MYYVTKPPVCGEFGQQTKWNPHVSPQTFEFIHFVFDRWPDDLVTSHPIFLANLELANKLIEVGCSGFSMQLCIVSKSEWFDSEGMQKDIELPVFVRLLVQGIPETHDLGIRDYDLIVSQKAKTFIEDYQCKAVTFIPCS